MIAGERIGRRYKVGSIRVGGQGDLGDLIVYGIRDDRPRSDRGRGRGGRGLGDEHSHLGGSGRLGGGLAGRSHSERHSGFAGVAGDILGAGGKRVRSAGFHAGRIRRDERQSQGVFVSGHEWVTVQQ